MPLIPDSDICLALRDFCQFVSLKNKKWCATIFREIIVFQMFYIVKKKRGINMQNKTMSEIQRNNQTALAGHTIEALLIVFFYFYLFAKGERSFINTLIVAAIALIPAILGQIFFFKDKETPMIKHTVGVGFAITYSIMVLTTEHAYIYVFVIPMIVLVTVFNDVKFSIQINTGTVVLSLIMTIGGAMTGKFGYKGADEAVVQVAIMIIVGVYSIYAAKTSEHNSQRKLEQMTQAQEKTEKLLQSVSSMSEQVQSGMEDIYAKVDALNQSSKVTKDAMTEVSTGTTETADAVQTQMTQTGAIQQKVEDVSLSADHIGKNMDHTMEVLGQANREVEVLLQQVEASVKDGVQVTGKLEKLDIYIEEMHSIVELISGITSQTNLLALNASIEAARAGEAGKGFSVVASEITSMATQTKDATVHIRELIENIAGAIKDVVSVVREMIEAINEEKQSTVNTVNNFSDIQNNTLEIQKNMEQLTNDIEELSKSNKQIMDSIETISAITEEVSAHANETMSEQEENSSVLNLITDRMQDLLKVAKQEV